MTDKVLRNGARIARYDAIEMPDHAYEAQVFVRLTREPEIAETYIPAGIYPTEQEALAGARERARRALAEAEF